jgi:glutamyl-tRNA synthetase
MNGEYIRMTDNNRLVDLIRPFLVEQGLTTNLWINSRWPWMLKFVQLMKERCHLLTEFGETGSYFFTPGFTFDPKGVEKIFSDRESVAAKLEKWVAVLTDTDEFSCRTLEERLRALSEELVIKPAELIHPIRLALSGVTGGPPLFEMMELLGKDESIGRIERAIKFLSKK